MDYKYSNHELTVQINISNREGKSCKAYTFSIIPPLAPPLPSLLLKQPQKKEKEKKQGRERKGKRLGVGRGRRNAKTKGRVKSLASSFTVWLDKHG